MAIVDIFPLENFIDLMHRILHGDLVREIGREHACLWSDPFNDIRQCALVPLTPHVASTATKVVKNRLLATKLAVLPLAFQPVDDQRNPTCATFQETNPELRECVPYTVLNHSCHGNRQGEWHAQRACSRESREGVESKVPVPTAMNTYGTIQFFRFLINGPKLFCAQMFS